MLAVADALPSRWAPRRSLWPTGHCPARAPRTPAQSPASDLGTTYSHRLCFSR
nr:MAG TPA: hypothetical protein [Caudoviricetes sp.]